MRNSRPPLPPTPRLSFCTRCTAEPRAQQAARESSVVSVAPADSAAAASNGERRRSRIPHWADHRLGLDPCSRASCGAAL